MTTHCGRVFHHARAIACATALLSLSMGALPAGAETLKAVMMSGLRVMDPITSTAFLTRDHGYMIYDTLLGVDENFQVQPQMADWTVSEDKTVCKMPEARGTRMFWPGSMWSELTTSGLLLCASISAAEIPSLPEKPMFCAIALRVSPATTVYMQ